MKLTARGLVLLCLSGLLACCSTLKKEEKQAPPTLYEAQIKEIPLAGPCSTPEAEISGMAWFGDHLILLPQYPERFLRAEAPQGVLCAIPREQIEAFLSYPPQGPGVKPYPALEPLQIPVQAGDLIERIKGYQGFESLAFDGQSVYLTIEAEPGDMEGYVVKGQLAADLSSLQIDPQPRPRVEAQADLGNMAYEATLLTPDGLLVFYEANGAKANPGAHAAHLGRDLSVRAPLPMEALECRLTDVTTLDERGEFWAMNYCWSENDDILPEVDALVERFGEGESHKQQKTVERLVKLRYSPQGVTLTDTQPIYLKLLPDDVGRNWEGIVRQGEGFLIITDKFQATTLAYVEAPPAGPVKEPR